MLCGLGTEHYRQIACMHFVMWLESQRKTTNFVWIPSNAEIHGNELADQVARLATEERTIEDIPIRPDDVKCYLKRKTIEKWQQTWNNNKYPTEFRQTQCSSLDIASGHEKERTSSHYSSENRSYELNFLIST